MVLSSSERGAPKERVLVIFPGALGDLVCLVPALRALARRHRDATLDLMAREELARFIVARIGIASGHSQAHSEAHSQAHSIDRREVAALFAENPELAEATRFFRPFTRIYSFFASDDARFRRGLEVAAAPTAVSFHAFRPAGPGHVAAGYLDEIGDRGAPLDARIEVLASDVAEGHKALGRLGLASARFVLLFPGSGSPHKNWPAHNFVALASALPPLMRALVVLGPAERRLSCSCYRSWPRTGFRGFAISRSASWPVWRISRPALSATTRAYRIWRPPLERAESPSSVQRIPADGARWAGSDLTGSE